MMHSSLCNGSADSRDANRLHLEAGGALSSAEKRPAVLLVDDDDAVRAVTSAILRAGGCVVVDAACGEDALEKCRRSQRRFELLVTDITMPGMPGWEVASEVRRMCPETRVLYVTGSVDEETVRRCGGDPIVRKPFVMSELLTLCLSLIAHARSKKGRRSAS